MVGDEILDLEAPGVIIDTVKAQPDDAAINYRYAQDPARSCGLCEHFSAPGKCELVAGTIRSVDTCNLFDPRPDGGRVRAEVVGDQGEAEDVAVPPSHYLPIDEPQVKLDAVQAVLIPQEHPRVQGYVPDAPPQVQAELAGRGEFGDPQGAPRVQSEAIESGTPDGAKKGWETRKGGGSAPEQPQQKAFVKGRPVMDAKMAHAIATDAGNASMRKGGRTVWSADDYSASVDAYNRALPEGPIKDELTGAKKSAKDLGVVAALRPH